MRSSIDVEREVNTTARFGDVEAEDRTDYVGQCHVVLGVAKYPKRRAREELHPHAHDAAAAAAA